MYEEFTMTNEEPRALAINNADELRASAISALNGFVGPKHSALEFAVVALMARILELQHAARNLMDHSPEVPIAIITLARAQYESYLTFKYILIQPTLEDRKKLAVDLLKFEAYEQVEAIGDNRATHRARLDDEEKKNFDRRIQVHDEVKANLSREQLSQGKYPTWNGLSVAGTAKAVKETHHFPLYDVMSKVAHCKPSMFHKSITIAQDGYVLGNVEKGEKDAVAWLEQMSHWLKLAIELLSPVEA